VSPISNFYGIFMFVPFKCFTNSFFIGRFYLKDALFYPEELENLEDIRKDIHSYREYVSPADIYFLFVKL
jgi:hypothetical protein